MEMKTNCKSLKTSWVENYPLHWINLERQRIRRKKMEWAISKGGWTAERWNAIDAKFQSNTFIVVPKLWQTAVNCQGYSAMMKLSQCVKQAEQSLPV